MNRASRKLAVAGVMTALAAVAFAPAARAGTPISLTSVSPTAGVWGTTFTMNGTTAANRQVRVQRMYVGANQWQDVTTTTSDDDGKFSTADQPLAHAWYRAFLTSDLSTSNWVKAQVRPGVHLGVGRSGEQAVFSGRVLPGHPGSRVLLQMFDGINKEWVTVKTARLNSSSFYRINYKATDNGRRLFRVAWPTQDNNHLWNLSAWVWVTWTR
ncbi:MAG TPA: hypothetical protein VM841_08385 [Actinomycetota bacterium]|nr:hypothetical protein [Actinomycetota bacterium]